MLSNTLKEYTSLSHQQLEAVLIKRLKAINTLKDYAEVLKLFYGFIVPLEIRIKSKISDSSLLPDYSERRKTDALINDIKQIDGKASEIDLNDHLPSITTPYDAIGALYVLEGSTLGGQIISKMIHHKLGKESDSALSYFNSYGEKTRIMWQKFRQVLDSDSFDGTMKDQILQAALNTFKSFSNWIEHWNQKKG